MTDPLGFGVLMLMKRISLILAMGVTAVGVSTALLADRDEAVNGVAASGPAAKKRAEQVPKSKAILDKYHMDNAVKGERKLHIVYWTPNDKEAAPRYQQRLQTIFEDIQKFYAKEMQRLGFGPLTVNLDYAADGKMKIHYVTGEGPYANYAEDSGQKIRNECRPILKNAGIDIDKETVVIFCNMSVWHEKHRTIRQNSPYYAGGTSFAGTAWQVDSPILELKHLTEQGNYVRDGQYGNISLGKYNTIFIGGIAHELGHALGMPHNLETADEAKEFGVALMGSGNRAYGDELRGEGKGAFLTLAHGLRLASHPMFSGSVKDFGRRAQSKVTQVKIENHGKSFTYSGKIESDIPCHAVIAYMDPDGGGDYDATTTSAIPESDGRFSLKCADLKPGATAMLNVAFLYANGDASHNIGSTPGFSYAYSVDQEGNVQMDEAMQAIALKPIVDAMNAGKKADALASDTPAKTREIAKRLRESATQKRNLATPSRLQPQVKEVVLTDTQPSSVSVGYGSVIYDRLPSRDVLLMAGRKIFATGMFAHAPSNVSYQLDGKWKKLSGKASIASAAPGTADFIIKGDGKVLWQSGKTDRSQLREFVLDVSGVKLLELITADAGDGNRSAWSLWLDVMLQR